MQDTGSPYVPTPSEGDQVHAVVRGIIGLAPGGSILSELFSLLFRAPLERRLQEWAAEVEARLRALYRRDSTIEAYLHSEVFLSVFVASTQAALRAHHRDKRRLLANAVCSSATSSVIAPDLQMLFVRFVDEMTTAHVLLLGVLANHEPELTSCQSYESLYELFVRTAGAGCTRDEFTLFCNDLESRVLARFSPSLEDFPGLASRTVIVTEDSGVGAKVVVTDLGRQFLTYVATSVDQPAA